MNLFNKATEVVGELIDTSGNTAVNANFTHSDYIQVNKNEVVSVVFTKKSNAQIVIIEYDINKNFIKGNFYDFRNTNADNKYTITTTNTTAFIIAEYRNDLNMGNMKVCKGSVKPYSSYNFGTVEVISKNGSNTSSNIAYVDEPLCSIGNVQDEIDYSKGKIIRRCGYKVLDGTESWQKHDSTANNVFCCTVLSNIKHVNSNNVIANILNTHFEVKAVNNIASNNIIGVGIDTQNTLLIGTGLNGISTVEQLKAQLTSNPVTLIYELATPVIENIDCSNKIVQYDEQTTVYNRDEAEIEVSLTNNKAISEVNEDMQNIEEKQSNMSNYSVEEQKIGTWIDEKPIYRKVLTYDKAINADTLFKIGKVNNVEKVISMNYVIRNTNRSQWINNYANNGQLKPFTLIMQTVDDYLYGLSSNESWGAPFLIVTIEYTKTTD